MKKNNGFTLIELIGVITLLSLIVLVSVPVIINTMNKSEQNEEEKFKKIVENAAELYLERNRDLYPHFNEIGDSIDINTETLIQEGYLKNDLQDPTNNNNVSKYKVAVTYGQDGIFKYQTVKRMIFAELATTTDEVTSVNACALSGTCQTGTKFAIKVNENDIYNFYVINDDGKDVTLIMDRNLGDNVAWYIDAQDNSYGPVTALSTLEERTSGWTNIPEHTYRVSGLGEDEATRKYEDIEYTGRARMLTYAEATDSSIGCTTSSGSCPDWLYKNLYGTGDSTKDSNGNYKYGYWTTTPVAIYTGNAWLVHYYGHVDDVDVSLTTSGLRPVITVSRSI